MSSLVEKTREVARRQLQKKHQLELFIADLVDAAPKSDARSMELPFFSLSKKIDTSIRELTIGNQTLRVEPGPAGRPTIWDKDILIFCASQITEALNRGETVGRTVRVESYALLNSTSRGTGGNSYSQLVSAIKRVKGTQYYIEEKAPAPGVRRQWRAIGGFVDDATITEYDDKKRAITLDITLSEGFFSALLSRQVLTFSRDYFALQGGLERRLYDIARKFCGRQGEWSISLEKLQQRAGAGGTIRQFRLAIRRLAAREEELPEYEVLYSTASQKGEGGKVTFRLRTREEEDEKRKRDDVREQEKKQRRQKNPRISRTGFSV